MLWEQMQEYGINDNESKLLCRRFLNDNQKEILKPYTNRNSNSSNGEYEEDGEDGEDVGGGLGGPTQSQIANLLISFAEDNATLFKDEFGVPHALLEIDNHH